MLQWAPRNLAFMGQLRAGAQPTALPALGGTTCCDIGWGPFRGGCSPVEPGAEATSSPLESGALDAGDLLGAVLADTSLYAAVPQRRLDLGSLDLDWCLPTVAMRAIMGRFFAHSCGPHRR